MKTSKSLTLLSALTLATTGVCSAASIYVPASQTDGYTNYVASGLYYTGGTTNTQNIGVVTGNAFVEASWGADPNHQPSSGYTFNGSLTPSAISQRFLWDQATGAGSGSWSGFGGPGAGTYALNSASTLVASNATGVSMTRVSALTGTIVTAASQVAANSPQWSLANTVAVKTPGDVSAGSTGASGYQFSTAEFFRYTPGLTGTYSLEVSWGIGNTSQPLANWWLDVNGTGNPADYVSLLSNVDTNRFSNGADYRTGVNGGTQIGQWSGFKDAGNVLLNPNSQIVYQSLNTAVFGTVSNIQLTTVPEPATWALLAGGLISFVALRRRRIA